MPLEDPRAPEEALVVDHSAIGTTAAPPPPLPPTHAPVEPPSKPAGTHAPLGADAPAADLGYSAEVHAEGWKLLERMHSTQDRLGASATQVHAPPPAAPLARARPVAPPGCALRHLRRMAPLRVRQAP